MGRTHGYGHINETGNFGGKRALLSLKPGDRVKTYRGSIVADPGTVPRCRMGDGDDDEKTSVFCFFRPSDPAMETGSPDSDRSVCSGLY